MGLREKKISPEVYATRSEKWQKALDDRILERIRIARQIGEEVWVRRNYEPMMLRVEGVSDECYDVVRVYPDGSCDPNPTTISRWELESGNEKL